MTKQSGLGQHLYVGGNSIGGDVGSFTHIQGGPSPLVVTGITKSAFERVGGKISGSMGFSSWFNPTGLHPVISLLPTTDVVATMFHGQAVGNPAVSCLAKQIGYDPNRGNDGSLAMATDLLSNGWGLEWGNQLTAGRLATANLLTGQNTDFEGGIGTWVTNQNSTVAGTSADAHAGTSSLAITTTNTSSASAKHVSLPANGFPVTPGASYYSQVWFKSAAVSRTCNNTINWFDSGSNFLSTSSATGAASSTSIWKLSSLRAVAPATAAFASLNVQVQTPAGAGEVHYFDDVTFINEPASWDGAASTTFGLQAYLHVFAFTGTDVTIKLQESSDNAATDAYADVTGGGFTAVTSAPFSQRIATSSVQTVKRYLRPVFISTGGFTALDFAIQVVKNSVAPNF
jgi:hypothetical protein